MTPFRQGLMDPILNHLNDMRRFLRRDANLCPKSTKLDRGQMVGLQKFGEDRIIIIL